MSKQAQFDVVIIGAGLGGLQCARLLGRAGMRVLLADRKRALDESVHTTGIFVRRTLEDFDLPADCLGPAVRGVTLYSPARRTLALNSPHEEFRVGRMGRMYLRFLADCERAGVVWQPQARYVKCEMTGRDRVIVQLEVGGRVLRVPTRFVVGADGAQSRVARDLDLDRNQAWIVGVEDVYTDVPHAGAPRFHCFLDPRLAPGYLAWVVHDGVETHVGVGGYAARFEPLAALAEFQRSLAGLFDLTKGQRIERRGGRIPVGGVLRRIKCAQGLLVGDAAGAVSPLTAGGLDPCMRLSSLAAHVIVDYLTSGDAAALDAYSGERFRARFASRLWLRRLHASLRDPLLLELACAAMRLPGLRGFARHVFFGRGSFPDVGPTQTAQIMANKLPVV
ncbi:MAG: NAD(P)/FAD-dependent oxidoreductase [Pyrinomonadaceae bacterium]